MFAPSPETAQDFANKLKRINIESVNYRYSHHDKPQRVMRCKLHALESDKYSPHDFAQLVQCWIYQACEKEHCIDFEIVRAYLEFKIQQTGADYNNSQLWAI
jgi:hypothetical protein